MIVRIVKMTFQPEKVDYFIDLFDQYKDQIRGFDGVKKLELYRDKNQNNILFTYSVWSDEHKLEKYRKSDLFKNVWKQTSALFQNKAEAWSVDKLISL